jgi:hypothetical protein
MAVSMHTSLSLLISSPICLSVCLSVYLPASICLVVRTFNTQHSTHTHTHTHTHTLSHTHAHTHRHTHTHTHTQVRTYEYLFTVPNLDDPQHKNTNWEVCLLFCRLLALCANIRPVTAVCSARLRPICHLLSYPAPSLLKFAILSSVVLPLRCLALYNTHINTHTHTHTYTHTHTHTHVGTHQS